MAWLASLGLDKYLVTAIETARPVLQDAIIPALQKLRDGSKDKATLFIENWRALNKAVNNVFKGFKPDPATLSQMSPELQSFESESASKARLQDLAAQVKGGKRTRRRRRMHK